jgi:tetratricopeptide (TPR) repeat protein
VYSLGATLWEVLTLRPLYDAPRKSDLELMKSIQYDDPGPVHAHNPHVPRDLSAIVARCLEKDARRRYATARELATDLGRWLRGDPVQAQPPTLRYLLGKAAWRYRRPLATAAVVLLLAAAGVVTAFVLITAAWEQTKNEKAAAEQEKARAEQEKARAEDNLALVGENAEYVVSKIIDNPKLKDLYFLRARRELLLPLVPYYQQIVRLNQGNPKLAVVCGQAYRRLACLRAELDETAEAVADAKRACQVLDGLTRDRPDLPAAHREQGLSYADLGRFLALHRKGPQALDAWQRAIRLQEQAAEAFPTFTELRQELALTFLTVGDYYLANRNPSAAIPWFLRATTIQGDLSRRFPDRALVRQELALGHLSLGNALTERGDYAGALAAYREALKIQQGDSVCGASTAGLLGSPLGQGPILAASALFPGRSRRGLLQELSRSRSVRQELANTHLNLGRLWEKSGNRAEALASYGRAVDLQEKLLNDYPENPAVHQEAANSYTHRGRLHFTLGRRTEAASDLTNAGIQLQKLISELPSVRTYALDATQYYCLHGDFLWAGGDPRGAERDYTVAVKTLRPIVKKSREDPEACQILQVAMEKLALILAVRGEHQAAATHWDEARGLVDEPSRALFWLRQARSLVVVGNLPAAVDLLDRVTEEISIASQR